MEPAAAAATWKIATWGDKDAQNQCTHCLDDDDGELEDNDDEPWM